MKRRELKHRTGRAVVSASAAMVPHSEECEDEAPPQEPPVDMLQDLLACRQLRVPVPICYGARAEIVVEAFEDESSNERVHFAINAPWLDASALTAGGVALLVSDPVQFRATLETLLAAVDEAERRDFFVTSNTTQQPAAATAVGLRLVQ